MSTLLEPINRYFKLTNYRKIITKYSALPFEWLLDEEMCGKVGNGIAKGGTEEQIKKEYNIRRLPKGFFEEAKAALELDKEELRTD